MDHSEELRLLQEQVDHDRELLKKRQINRELNAIGLGVARYRKEVKQKHTRTTVGQRLRDEAAKLMLAELANEISQIPPANQARQTLLLGLDNEQIALATATAIVNEMAIGLDDAPGRKRRPVTRVAIELGQTLANTINYETLSKKIQAQLTRWAAQASNPRQRQERINRAQERCGCTERVH